MGERRSEERRDGGARREKRLGGSRTVRENARNLRDGCAGSVGSAEQAGRRVDEEEAEGKKGEGGKQTRAAGEQRGGGRGKRSTVGKMRA